MYHRYTPRETLFGYDTGDLILLLILFLLLRDGSEKAPLAVWTLVLYFFLEDPQIKAPEVLELWRNRH